MYIFTDRNGNRYVGSTNNFRSRMGNHLKPSGRLPPGTTVKFIPVKTAGRSATGARRVRRFFEQQERGLDPNGIPIGNPSLNGGRSTRAVSPDKWQNYTDGKGNINFDDPYFQ